MFFSLRLWGYEVLSINAGSGEEPYAEIQYVEESEEDCDCDDDPDEDARSPFHVGRDVSDVEVDPDVDLYAVETLSAVSSHSQRFGFRPSC